MSFQWPGFDDGSRRLFDSSWWQLHIKRPEDNRDADIRILTFYLLLPNNHSQLT